MAAPTAQMAAPSDECFHGGDVLPDHPAPPPYELPQADPFVPDITSPLLSKRCAGNQDWADWRWVPSSRQCASGLRGRTYYEVCSQLRGRRLFYVGDSTQFEMFVSMGMLMGGQISLRPQERPWHVAPWRSASVRCRCRIGAVQRTLHRRRTLHLLCRSNRRRDMLNVSTGSWRSHTFRRLCNGSATLSWARADFLHERRLGLAFGLGLG